MWPLELKEASCTSGHLLSSSASSPLVFTVAASSGVKETWVWHDGDSMGREGHSWC